jgi:hypothetical protein
MCEKKKGGGLKKLGESVSQGVVKIVMNLRSVKDGELNE